MNEMLCNATAVLGRLMLTGIFIMSALGNNIPKFYDVAGYMAVEGVPMPKVALAGAIVFLLAGGFSILLGYKPRIGATLLLVFLILATYYFHDFWKIDQEADPQKYQTEMIAFMKNAALMGAMLFIMANGGGRACLSKLKVEEEE
ncbi:MAG: DoxX family protein [Lacipirellulaceae bacterium]